MSEHRTAETHAVSGWATGFAAFAGVVMMIVGFFHAITGLAGIIDDDFYVVTQNYAFDVNVTTWGWIQLVLGVVVLFAGWGILSGATWARIVGMIVATVSAVANFFFIPYYPVWAVLVIALDIAIIWALAVYTSDEPTRAY
ncbi:MAG TPA: hypothetical protein VFO03_02100 [Gaiellaceae bacterium]|nr:hypothetical protein [Gaiellaceae bacterium]